MIRTSAWLILGIFLALTPMTSSVRGEDSAPASDIKPYEGTYDRVSSGCAYSAHVTLSEETDPTTDLVAYHLQILRADGGVWNSREFRQLNRLPWYKASVGNNGTLSGRSRFTCNDADCVLWNEHKTCQGGIIPLCSGWKTTRSDEVVFEGRTMTLYTDADGVCTYSKR